MTNDPNARLQKLIRRLRSKNDVKRVHAGLLLGNMGPAAKEAVPTLLDLLREANAKDRRLAAWTLGYLGAAAAEAIPALLVAVSDPDEGVRKMAREALDKISPVDMATRAA